MAAGTPRLIGEKQEYSSNSISIVRTYQVPTTSMSDGLSVAEAAVSTMIPPTGYYAAQLTGERRKDNPLDYDVEITYQIPPWPGDQSNPLLRPATFSVSYNEISEPYFLDCTPGPVGPKTVSTSADELFENFPTRRSNKERMILEMTKNYDSFAAVAYDLLKNTLNEVAVVIEGTVYAAKTLLFIPVRAQKVIEVVGQTKYTYYAVTFRCEADHGQFTDNIEDRGYKQLDDSGNQIPIYVNQLPVTFPYPLDGNGNAQDDASVAPAILPFLPYAPQNWGIDFS